MKRDKKFFSILLACIMIISTIYPVFSAGINIDPNKDLYLSGEKVQLKSDFEVEDGINWYYMDKNEKKDILEKSKNIEFSIPENNTNETVSTVVYAVYNDDKKWISFDIASNENDIITLSTGGKRLFQYGILQLNVVLKEGYKDKEVGFKLVDENNKVATVDKNGVIKGKQPGECKIEAYLIENSTISSKIIITVDPFQLPWMPYGYKIDGPKTMNIEGKTKLVLWTKDAQWRYGDERLTFSSDQKDYVKFTSSNPDVADFDDEGYLLAKKPGKVTITGEAKTNSRITSTLDIEIPVDVNYQLSSKWKRDINVGGTLMITPFTIDSNENIYVSSNSDIVKMDKNGKSIDNFKSSSFGELSIGNIKGREYLISRIKKSEMNELQIIDIDTGDTQWKGIFEEAIHSNPIVDEKSGNIYLVGYGDTGAEKYRALYAINKDVENILWKVNLDKKKKSYDGKPGFVIHDGKIYVLINYELFAFNSNGNKLWKFTGDNGFESRTTTKPILGKKDTIYMVDTKKLYAINATDGSKKWDKEFDKVISKYPVLSPDKQYIYITGVSKSKLNLFKIDANTGNIKNECYPGGAYGTFGENGYLYTNTMIYDRNIELISYYNQQTGKKREDQFYVGEDGTVYRIIEGKHRKGSGIERAELCDATDEKITAIKVFGETPINMFQGEIKDISASAINEYGASFPEVGLQWKSDDETVVTAVYGDNSNNATITAKKEGTARITLEAEDKGVTKNVKVNIKEAPVPQTIYFKTRLGEKLESIEGYVGEGLTSPWVQIEDQYGNFVKKQSVDWSVDDDEILGYLLYEGGSGNRNIKYQACLSAGKPGETILRVTLKNYPEVSCEIPVKIKPNRTQILWDITHEYEGLKDNKHSYHIMGKNDEIYYTTKKFIRAINKNDQTELWKHEMEDEKFRGFAAPKLDEEGNIYVYERYNPDCDHHSENKVWAFDSESGDILYETAKEFYTIREMQVTQDYVYILTYDNKLYQLDKKLNKTWADPIEFEDSMNMVSKDNNLYVSAKDKIYKINSDKSQEIIYEDKYSQLWIEGITAQGNIILQKNVLGHYSILSIDGTRNKNWQYKGLESKVNVGINEEGKIYAIEESSRTEKFIYFLDNDGTERVKKTFMDGDGKGYGVKPVIGKDGTVYVAAKKTTALSQEGEVLWQSELLGSFVTYIPDSIVVEDNGVLYMGAYGKGILAIKGKKQEGLGVLIKGKEDLALDTFKDLELKLTNYEEEWDVVVKISLKDMDLQRVLSETSIEDRLQTNITRKYEFGVKIPKEGKFQIKVNIIDKISGETIYREDIEI